MKNRTRKALLALAGLVASLSIGIGVAHATPAPVGKTENAKSAPADIRLTTTLATQQVATIAYIKQDAIGDSTTNTALTTTDPAVTSDVQNTIGVAANPATQAVTITKNGVPTDHHGGALAAISNTFTPAIVQNHHGAISTTGTTVNTYAESTTGENLRRHELTG